MPVLVEAISVIIRRASIIERVRGGREAFLSLVPNSTLCADEELVRVGFMTPEDAGAFVSQLEEHGLRYLNADGKPQDIVVADQVNGLTTQCDWIHFFRVDDFKTGAKVAACRLNGVESWDVALPNDWVYETSLSKEFGFVPDDGNSGALRFLRRDGNVEVHFDTKTGREVYVARAASDKEKLSAIADSNSEPQQSYAARFPIVLKEEPRRLMATTMPKGSWAVVAGTVLVVFAFYRGEGEIWLVIIGISLIVTGFVQLSKRHHVSNESPSGIPVLGGPSELTIPEVSFDPSIKNEQQRTRFLTAISGAANLLVPIIHGRTHGKWPIQAVRGCALECAQQALREGRVSETNTRGVFAGATAVFEELWNAFPDETAANAGLYSRFGSPTVDDHATRAKRDHVTQAMEPAEPGLAGIAVASLILQLEYGEETKLCQPHVTVGTQELRIEIQALKVNAGHFAIYEAYASEPGRLKETLDSYYKVIESKVGSDEVGRFHRRVSEYAGAMAVGRINEAFDQLPPGSGGLGFVGETVRDVGKLFAFFCGASNDPIVAATGSMLFVTTLDGVRHMIAKKT